MLVHGYRTGEDDRHTTDRSRVRLPLGEFGDDDHGHLKLGHVLLWALLLVVGGSAVAVAIPGQTNLGATAESPAETGGGLAAADLTSSDERAQPPEPDEGPLPEGPLDSRQAEPPDEAALPEGPLESHQPEHPDGDPEAEDRDEDSVSGEGSGCELYGPTVGPSPVIDGGTRLDYAVECNVSHFNSMTVQIRTADGDVVASVAEQTPLLANAQHARQYDLPTSIGALGIPDGLCVSIRVDDHVVANDASESCTSVTQLR